MPERMLSTDDIRHRAEEVRALAVREVRSVVAHDSVRLFVAGAIGVLAIASLAYYLGTRVGRSR